MLLAEELMLLLLDDEKGTMPFEASAKIDMMLGGALLVELALLQRVGVTARKPGDKPDRLTILDSAPTGDPLLDETLVRLAKLDGKAATDAVWTAYKGARSTIIDRLLAQGALDEDRTRVLGIFPSRTLPAGDPRWEREVRGRVTAALEGTAAPDPHTGSIIALLLAGDLLDKAFPQADKEGRRRLKERAEQVSTSLWASDATRQALDNAQATLAIVTTAVIIPSAVIGAGGG